MNPALALKIRVIRPPTEDGGRSEMTFAVPLLDSARVGEILQVEQLLNTITGVRWHISVDPADSSAPLMGTLLGEVEWIHCTGCGAQVAANLAEYNSSGTQALCPVCQEKEQS